MGHLKTFLAVFFCLSLIGCSGVHVKQGDTLYSIAKKNDIPMRAIIEKNHLKPPYTLSVGQYLKFPQNKTYRAEPGDTLYSIATRNDMTVSFLARLNHIEAPYQLSVGQVLRISTWSGDTAPVPHTFTPAHRPGKGSVAQDRQTEKRLRAQVKNPSSFKGNAFVPKSQSGKRFSWPTKGKITSDFSAKNDGINISGTLGSPIQAADKGTVAYAGNGLKGYGNLILIKHDNGWITAYAHNNKLLVKKGQLIKKGQKIAEMGKTGNVKTPQLHFEVRYKAKVVNPHAYLK